MSDATTTGPELDPRNGARGAYDEEPSDNQAVDGLLENRFPLVGRSSSPAIPMAC